MQIERTWTHADHRYTLRQHDSMFVLSLDDREVLRGDRDGLRLLARHLETMAGGRPFNSGRPWTEPDDTLLAELHALGADVVDLAGRFERSSSAIRARLTHLGLIEDDGTWRRFASSSA